MAVVEAALSRNEAIVESARKLRAQIVSAIAVLERRYEQSPGKFFELLLRRYQRDLALLEKYSVHKLRAEHFLLKGGLHSYLSTDVPRDFGLERELRKTEALLQEYLAL